MKPTPLKNKDRKKTFVFRNKHVGIGLFSLVLTFGIFSLLTWNALIGFYFSLVFTTISIPYLIIKDYFGKKKHISIHDSKLFKELKQLTFRDEIFGEYKGLISNENGRTIRIYYDWNKYAQGLLSSGDLVIHLFYEPLIEEHGGFEIQENVITALNKRHEVRYHSFHRRHLIVDRMIININYYRWTKLKTVLTKIEKSIKIIETENLAPFDIENLNGRFTKQNEERWFLPRTGLVDDEIERQLDAKSEL
jgi:hypothetical protein